MSGSVGAQRSSWDIRRVRNCAEAVAENKGTFELCPFFFTQSRHGEPQAIFQGKVNGHSERFKKDIATMDKASEAILSLRPVTFHYKTDTKGIPQFGLIAEEVAKANSALVLPDKEGKPYTVRYDAVNAMLLNEFLKEHKAFIEGQRKVEQQESGIQEQAAMIARQQKQIETLTAGLQRVSAQLELNKSAPQTVVNNR